MLCCFYVVDRFVFGKPCSSLPLSRCESMLRRRSFVFILFEIEQVGIQIGYCRCYYYFKNDVELEFDVKLLSFQSTNFKVIYFPSVP